MTPGFYLKIGSLLEDKKKIIVMSVIISFTLLFSSLFIPTNDSTAIKYLPFGIFGFFTNISWGLFMVVHGYSSKGKLNPEITKTYTGYKKYSSTLITWYASIFITLWFLATIFYLPWIVWSQITNNA